MPLVLGCIADDYTGATDLANTLTRNGLRTLQVQGVPKAAVPLPDVDAIVVALKSRSIEPDRAVALSLAAHDWLVKRGAAHVLFKVCSTFDSTDRGNIGPVVDALRGRHGGALMPVTPAFPETGRTVYQGLLFVGDTLLSDSPLKDHPLNPMRDANLVRVLARQSGDAVGLLNHGVIDAGVEAVRAALLRQDDMGSVICDALSERHLETIGRAVFDGPLSTGASGLGLGLARAFVAAGRVPGGETGPRAERAQGRIAIIAGSCSRATLDQIAAAEGVYPIWRLSPDELMADISAAIDHACGWAAPHLVADQPFLIAASADSMSVERAQALYGREAIAERIEQALADIAARLVERGVRKLVVAGGETSGAVVDRLAVPAFLIGAEVAPGVPVVHARGTEEPMSLVLKSGNFGARSFFADAVAELTGDA